MASGGFASSGGPRTRVRLSRALRVTQRHVRSRRPRMRWAATAKAFAAEPGARCSATSARPHVQVVGRGRWQVQQGPARTRHRLLPTAAPQCVDHRLALPQ